MPIHEGLYSGYGQYAIQSGFSDVIAIVRDSPRESDLTATASQIRAQDILPIESFSFSNQQNVSGERRGGEGADPNTFNVDEITLTANFRLPLMAPAIGWVDPAFGTLYDATRYAYWGTPTAAMSLITSGGTLSSGATSLVVDNIADFVAIPTPFNVEIIADPDGSETSETRSCTAVNKATRTLTITATAFPHDTETTYISARPDIAMVGPTREPAFSLFTSREGMLSPCLVNKLTIEASADNSVIVDAEILAHRIFRDRQQDIREELDTLLPAFSRQGSLRIVNGFGTKVETTTANTGNFGLSTAVGDDLFAGFQSLRIPPSYIQSITLTIENNLRVVHASHSLWAGSKKRRENSYPFALASEGRKVSGKIEYLCPVDSWAAFERLGGPASINGGGLKITYGTCSLTLSEVIWSPSSSQASADAPQRRTIEFQLASEDFGALPELDIAVQS